MFNGIFRVPQPVNEPVLDYAPNSPERAEVQAKLTELLGAGTEVPMIIDGQELKNGSLANMICPHDHQHVLGSYHKAGPPEVQRAIDAASARIFFIRASGANSLPFTMPMAANWPASSGSSASAGSICTSSSSISKWPMPTLKS